MTNETLIIDTLEAIGRTLKSIQTILDAQEQRITKLENVILAAYATKTKVKQ